MLQRTLTIATRESPLALWQANHVARKLRKLWPQLAVKLLPMKTSGDRFLQDKLLNYGGKSLFVKELEEALLNGQADIAVHSMKDVPVNFPHGLALATILKRENPFDAFLSKSHDSLASLPPRAIVGTASLRRQTQVLNFRPDLSIKTLRGNVQTRMAKLNDGEFDAIILAASGLERMNQQHEIKEIFSAEVLLPSCGQGALGIEYRENDSTLEPLLAPLNDPLSALCVNTERHVNRLLGGSCRAPIAVFCSALENGQLLLRAKVLSSDGQILLQNSQQGKQRNSEALAKACAHALLANGAEKLIQDASRS